MLRSFEISFRLRIAYRVNTILYRLEHLLRFVWFFPHRAYGARWLKSVATGFAWAWEVIGLLLGKLLYIGLIFWCATVGGGIPVRTQSAIFLTFYVMLTIAGALADSWMFSFSRNDYYAIILMRMNARERALSGFGYSALKSVVGSLPMLLIFGMRVGLPWWLCLLMAFVPSGAKAVAVRVTQLKYGRTGNFQANRLLGMFTWGIAAAVFAVPIVLRALRMPFPPIVSVALMVVTVFAGVSFIPQILGFGEYPEICKTGVLEAVHVLDSVKDGSLQRKRVQKSIQFDSSHAAAGNGRTGLAYLNALFISRHRKILWGASLRYTLFCVMGAAVAIVIFVIFRSQLPDPVTFLPWLLLIMYFINRGTVFTQALYMNCDHSLLTYPCYKQPGRILELFRLRLWEITKINLLPAVVLGVAAVALLAIHNPMRPAYEYPVAFLSVVVIAVFFSVHYLAMYYLLQPYNAAVELKSFWYSLTIGVTYGVCYLIAFNFHNAPLLLFGGVCLAFCILYSIAACLAVYLFAPRTFRIKA